MRWRELALVVAIATWSVWSTGCGDDCPAPIDATAVDAAECCLPGCPAPAPECCTTPDDPRPICEASP